MPEWSDEQESLADAEDQRPHRALEVTRRKFTGQLAGLWAYLNGVEIRSSRPGTPTDTDVVEKAFMQVRAIFLSSASLPEAWLAIAT